MSSNNHHPSPSTAHHGSSATPSSSKKSFAMAPPPPVFHSSTSQQQQLGIAASCHVHHNSKNIIAITNQDKKIFAQLKEQMAKRMVVPVLMKGFSNLLLAKNHYGSKCVPNLRDFLLYCFSRLQHQFDLHKLLPSSLLFTDNELHLLQQLKK